MVNTYQGTFTHPNVLKCLLTRLWACAKVPYNETVLNIWKILPYRWTKNNFEHKQYFYEVGNVLDFDKAATL